MTDERRPAELPATLDIPAEASTYTVRVHTRDAIIALQAAGYLVFEAAELPVITTNGEGKPKLPAGWGEQPYLGTRPVVEVYYEEAFGKLALARWWEKEAERREKRKEALRRDIQDVPSRTDYATDRALAEYLVDRGWRRG